LELDIWSLGSCKEKMKQLKKGQRGFTLIELLVTIAVAGAITGGIAVGIMQLLTINTGASNHMIAVRQVQQAGKEVSKDALQARPSTINVTPPGGNFLVLNWTDWEAAENEVVYNLQDMPSSPGLKTLQRIHTINGTSEATAFSSVAEYIDDAIDPSTGKSKTCCEWDPISGVLTFTVTATVGTESETRVYEIEPRVG